MPPNWILLDYRKHTLWLICSPPLWLCIHQSLFTRLRLFRARFPEVIDFSTKKAELSILSNCWVVRGLVSRATVAILENALGRANRISRQP